VNSPALPVGGLAERRRLDFHPAIKADPTAVADAIATEARRRRCTLTRAGGTELLIEGLGYWATVFSFNPMRQAASLVRNCMVRVDPGVPVASVRLELHYSAMLWVPPWVAATLWVLAAPSVGLRLLALAVAGLMFFYSRWLARGFYERIVAAGARRATSD